MNVVSHGVIKTGIKLNAIQFLWGWAGPKIGMQAILAFILLQQSLQFDSRMVGSN